jgi:hypothetical protein
MELILILIFVALFAVITYKMAESRGRNAWGYTIAGILISPVIMWIALAILGKTKEKEEDDFLAMKSRLYAKEVM